MIANKLDMLKRLREEKEKNAKEKKDDPKPTRGMYVYEYK
jgi:hypothetical protein